MEGHTGKYAPIFPHCRRHSFASMASSFSLDLLGKMFNPGPCSYIHWQARSSSDSPAFYGPTEKVSITYARVPLAPSSPLSESTWPEAVRTRGTGGSRGRLGFYGVISLRPLSSILSQPQTRMYLPLKAGATFLQTPTELRGRARWWVLFCG
jgi:hypothetical protein